MTDSHKIKELKEQIKRENKAKELSDVAVIVACFLIAGLATFAGFLSDAGISWVFVRTMITLYAVAVTVMLFILKKR